MYMKPGVKTLFLVEDANILAASGEGTQTPTIKISDREQDEISGTVDAKGHTGNGVWDD